MAAARRPIAGLGLGEHARRSPARRGTAPGPWPSSRAATTNSSASAARGHERLDAVEHEVAAVATRGRLPGANGSNSGRGSSSASAAAGDVLAGERRAGRSPAGRRRPSSASAVATRRARAARRRGPCRRGRAPRRRARRSRPSARRSTPPSSSGTPSIAMPSSAAWAQQLGRRGAGGVGVGRGRAQLLGGEGTHGLDAASAARRRA